jgi:hypothetical protein
VCVRFETSEGFEFGIRNAGHLHHYKAFLDIKTSPAEKFDPAECTFDHFCALK